MSSILVAVEGLGVTVAVEGLGATVPEVALESLAVSDFGLLLPFEFCFSVSGDVLGAA